MYYFLDDTWLHSGEHQEDVEVNELKEEKECDGCELVLAAEPGYMEDLVQDDRNLNETECGERPFTLGTAYDGEYTLYMRPLQQEYSSSN